MNSSIFNFDHFRRYAALPANERRWHAALAIVAAVLLLLCHEVPGRLFGRAGCPDETLGSAALASLSDRTQVLFVGSSHVLFGIRPERYSVRAMNLAATWLDYTCARTLIEKQLPRVPNLKVVVIEYDELPLVADLVPAMVGANDVRPLTDLGLTPWEFPTADWLLKFRVIYTAWMFPLTSLPRLTPLDWTNRTKACTPLLHPWQGFSAGYYYTDAVTPASYNAEAVYRSLRSAAGHEDVVLRNLRSLQETIGLLRRRGITVILMRLPHAPDYRQHRPALVTERWRLLKASMRAQTQIDPGILLLDWGEKPEFQAGDFCDNHHLNVFGADKLARLLDPDLSERCLTRR